MIVRYGPLRLPRSRIGRKDVRWPVADRTYLSSSACTPLDEASDIRMALDASKKAALCSVLPQHDVQLPGVI